MVEFDHPVPYNRADSSCRLRSVDVRLEEREGFIWVYGAGFACKVPMHRVLHAVYVGV